MTKDNNFKRDAKVSNNRRLENGTTDCVHLLFFVLATVVVFFSSASHTFKVNFLQTIKLFMVDTTFNPAK